MFVREAGWEKLISLLHVLSSRRASCVFTFRMVDGRVSASTIKDIRKIMKRFRIYGKQPVGTQEEEIAEQPVHTNGGESHG